MQFPFTHLHVHSCYSILDGMSSIDGLVDKARKDGMNSIALTDHGNMFGIKEFINYVKKINKPVLAKINDIEKKLKETKDEQNILSLQAELQAEKAKLFKPIIGCEGYMARRGMLLKDKTNKTDRGGWHLILLAKNKKGYQNLCKLVSAAWIDGHYYKPRIDKELLEKYHEGLIVSSACLGGEIPQKLMGNFAKDVDDEDVAQSGIEDLFTITEENMREAEKSVQWFKNIFGDDFYLEIQRHKTDKPNADTRVFKYQQIVNKAIIELGRRTDTKVIATNDVHFVEEEHAEAHDRLICLSTGKDLDDPKRMRYTKQEWLKTPQQMWEIFADLPQVLENTMEVADKIESFSIDSDALMPVFEIPADFGTEQQYAQKFSEEMLREEFGGRFEQLGGYKKVVRVKLESDYLTQLTYKGAAERYKDLTDEIRERIDFELNTIKLMGFPGYFLIVQDFISAARAMNVFVGPGRGSVVGSVVAYCLKIMNIDPFKYDLLFERFLNPDRNSLPDIDTDFDDDGRDKILQWVTEKYGKERVARVITYGTMAAKSSIKDVARVQKLPLSEANRLVKLIPDKLPEDREGKSVKVNLTNVYNLVPEMRAELSSPDQNIVTTLKYAEMLEGTVRQTGVHACGVIIGADDLTNFVPVSTVTDKETNEEVLVTQYEGAVIEDVGLIKMDFLGLKTLSIIKEALNNIKKTKNIDLDINDIPPDDRTAYELFSAGRTVGIFQFESDGMRKYLRDLQPSEFKDLIAMNALYRPGPMQYIPSFINRKHGREKISYDFPQMEKRLKETYGVTVYQEQVMLLSRDIAGFTRGQSDDLRKAMGKKDKTKMASLREKFMEGAQKNGYAPIKKLEKIWDDWSEFAKYAFNKSHATAYSLVAYQTAYLKAHFPAEFMAANLTRNRDNITEVSKFMDECKAMGINVLSPDVNESDLNFTVTQKGNIRFGLGGIKGVGEGAAIAIINERENGKYKSIFDFIERNNLTSTNKRVLESLALSGAFDGLGIRREQLFEKNPKTEDATFIETLIRYGNKFQTDKSANQISLFGGGEAVQIVKPEIPHAEEWSILKKLNAERELIGIYLSAHPLDTYEFEVKFICNTKTIELTDLQAIKNRQLKIGGIITSVRHATTKAGNPCGFFTLEDYDGAYEFALFGKNYPEFRNYMIKDAYVMITATVQERGADFRYGNQKQQSIGEKTELEMKIQRIDMLENVRNTSVGNLTISIPYQKIDDDFVAALTQQITENKGMTNLYIKIFDQMQSGGKLTLFARKHRININHNFFRFLKNYESQDILEFAAA
ncbi:MAG: DNA polymerase III subunit alpha [Paludibacter sp.]|nr:DNA polymerase III subunit alpha [Paludibacter sp.]